MRLTIPTAPAAAADSAVHGTLRRLDIILLVVVDDLDASAAESEEDAAVAALPVGVAATVVAGGSGCKGSPVPTSA